MTSPTTRIIRMPKSVKILALDLATRTGYAHNAGVSGVMDFTLKRGESPGMKWLKFEIWLDAFVIEYATDLIVYEQAHHRGGAATHSAHALIASAERVAASRCIEISNYHSMAIKKHAIPNKKKKRCKVSMVRAAMARWPNTYIVDDNHADALWLMDFACTDLGVC